MSNAQSNDSLRQLNAKLLAEISELKKENAEIPDLKRKFAEIESEKVELKARIAELLRQAVEENKRRDVENAELKARIEELEKNKTVTTKLESENAEFRDRITKVEQRQMLNDPKGNNSSNNNSSNFNSVTEQRLEHKQDVKMDTSLPKELIPEVSPPSSKSSKEMEIDAFLDGVHKKKASDEIRQRNREKKLQAQVFLPIHPEEKTSQELNSVIQSYRTRKREWMNSNASYSTPLRNQGVHPR
jgi:hypothetical protein